MDKLYTFHFEEDGVERLSWFDGTYSYTIGSSARGSFVSPQAADQKQADIYKLNNGELRIRACGKQQANVFVERDAHYEKMEKGKAFKPLPNDLFHFSPTLTLRIVYPGAAITSTTSTSTSSMAPQSQTTTSTSTSSASSSTTTSTSTTPSSSSAPSSAPVLNPTIAPPQPPPQATPAKPKIQYSSKTSPRPSLVRPPAQFSTPRPSRRGYPLRFLDPKTPQSIPFPATVEPHDILRSSVFVPSAGGNHVAFLFHVPITKDLLREKREIDDIIQLLRAWGFKVEFIQEATYDMCQKSMNERLKMKKDRGEVIDTLCMFVASHGTDNSSERLSILMADGSFLDSAQLATWAFDFKAKYTFIVLLTCHAEAAGHGIAWPDSTRGGIIWASTRSKTANFRHFDVSYPDGSIKRELHDVFVRSLFEILFCLVDVTELQYNISFDAFCALCRSAISTADKTSSFGHQSNWNGREVPLRFEFYNSRQRILIHGCDAQRIEKINGKICWNPYYAVGRAMGGGVTDLTAVLQKQIDDRTTWDDADVDHTVIDLTESGSALETRGDEADNHLTFPLTAKPSEASDATSNEGEDSSEADAESVADDAEVDDEDELSEDENDNESTVDLDSLTDDQRKIAESKVFVKFQTENKSKGWALRPKPCGKCTAKMVCTNACPSLADRADFQKLGLKFFSMCGRKNAKSCWIACPIR